MEEDGLRENSRDVMLLALQMEEEAISPGIGGAFRSWKRQGNSLLRVIFILVQWDLHTVRE